MKSEINHPLLCCLPCCYGRERPGAGALAYNLSLQTTTPTTAVRGMETKKEGMVSVANRFFLSWIVTSICCPVQKLTLFVSLPVLLPILRVCPLLCCGAVRLGVAHTSHIVLFVSQVIVMGRGDTRTTKGKRMR